MPLPIAAILAGVSLTGMIGSEETKNVLLLALNAVLCCVACISKVKG